MAGGWEQGKEQVKDSETAGKSEVAGEQPRQALAVLCEGSVCHPCERLGRDGSPWVAAGPGKAGPGPGSSAVPVPSAELACRRGREGLPAPGLPHAGITPAPPGHRCYRSRALQGKQGLPAAAGATRGPGANGTWS